ncbi:MAG: hypothetical protein HZA77_07740 [Candidatus Schekmanbacteria bacterium]|nr:hypothetical protein [Candidatus Schekmanbacteria bacterium]
MSRIVDFVVILDDGVRKRHYHETKEGRIAYFTVQLEIKVKNEWEPVIRYDCSHQFSHMDKYDIKGNKIKVILNLSFESALTYGDWDINENWVRYKEEFLKGVLNE